MEGYLLLKWTVGHMLYLRCILQSIMVISYLYVGNQYNYDTIVFMCNRLCHKLACLQ